MRRKEAPFENTTGPDAGKTSRDARRTERTINYLRISVTDLCNYRCIYCMPSGRVRRLPHSEILSFEEIATVVRAAVPLGINKLRLTGGEPLVRKGVPKLVEMLARVPGIEEIYLTTNGSLLEKLALPLKRSGLTRINISLDSLRPDRYREITRGGDLEKLWRGIAAAEKAGFSPIKLNVVMIKGINDDEIEEIAALTFDRSYEIRFIEYMPLGPCDVSAQFVHVPAEEIKRRLAKLGALMPLPKWNSSGPAERFQLQGARGTLGFISAMSHNFCATCNRIRLTADGRLLSCLFSGQTVEVKSLLRSSAPPSRLKEAIQLAISLKPAARASTCRNFMNTIGG
ncbi:MAG: GTP 3',8-cyclase MoaA [Candidatus Abyssobacteria bacterium SURF_5]|uniref:GTP 3',8-cyclase n=1 Tax=Abyssobacteria bacterium (strain SURF_5) TaxID=2093360 RepID=A0A3A4P4Z1_ABYX5|nr:MAG: GTP 3',8-cyclase MoaA [Candidatus Abyssubacteria bacterium SURF_5]